MLAPVAIDKSKQTSRTPRSSESSLPGSETTPSKRVYLLSETSDGSSDGSSNGDCQSVYDVGIHFHFKIKRWILMNFFNM